MKCELYHDSMQSWKCYPIQKAQLIIADVPYVKHNGMETKRTVCTIWAFRKDEIQTIEKKKKALIAFYGPKDEAL